MFDIGSDTTKANILMTDYETYTAKMTLLDTLDDLMEQDSNFDYEGTIEECKIFLKYYKNTERKRMSI